MTRILYSIVAVLAVVTLWQAWSFQRVYGFLDSRSASLSIGADPKEAKVTIIAFIDYAARPSKDINARVMDAVESQSDARIIFHSLPQDSEVARKTARLAMAAAKQGHFARTHEELMRNERPLSDAVIRELAVRLDLDADRWIADSESAEIYEDLAVTIAAAQKLRIAATPAFVFNRKSVYIPYEKFPTVLQLRNMINNARNF